MRPRHVIQQPVIHQRHLVRQWHVIQRYPQGQAAVGACSSWGNRIHNDVAGQNQAVMGEYVRFARCMRAHGLPGFPDPAYAERRVEFVLSASQDGFDPHSPQVLAKAHRCESVLPPGSGLPSVEVRS